jgi:hypothetical protein
MKKFIVLIATAASLAACTNFPCSPQNPCAPGDGGASLRAVGATLLQSSQPQPVVYTPMPSAAPRIIHCHWNGPVWECM